MCWAILETSGQRLKPGRKILLGLLGLLVKINNTYGTQMSARRSRFLSFNVSSIWSLLCGESPSPWVTDSSLSELSLPSLTILGTFLPHTAGTPLCPGCPWSLGLIFGTICPGSARHLWPGDQGGASIVNKMQLFAVKDLFCPGHKS